MSKYPTDRKFTNKNIQFDLRVNTNDEAVPGFKNISDIDPNTIAKSVISRPGYAQSTLFEAQPNNLNYPYQQTSLGIIPAIFQAAYYNAPVPVGNYLDSNDGLYHPNCIFTAQNTYSLAQISIMIAYTNISISAPGLCSIILYDYDLSTGQIGNQIGISNGGYSTSNVNSPSIVWSGYYPNPQTVVFNTINNLTYKEPVRIQVGKSYMIKLSFSVNTGADTLYIQGTDTVDNRNFGIAQTTIPTQPTIYTPLSQGWYLQFNIHPLVQNNLSISDITQLQTLGGNNTGTLISRIVNPLNNSFGFGVLSELQSTQAVINNDKQYPIISIKDLIAPTMSPTQPAISLMGNSYPACYYGFKLENSIHDFGIAYGNQLKGRATSTDKLYPMICRASGDINFHPITAEVTLPSAPIVYNYAGAQETTGLTVVREGVYEYAFEFIDKTGYPYQTDSANNTIVQVSVGSVGQYKFNLSTFTSVWNALNSSDKAQHGFIQWSSIYTIPIPTGPIANATGNDYPIINVYRRPLLVVEPGIPANTTFNLVSTPDSEFTFVVSATIANFNQNGATPNTWGVQDNGFIDQTDTMEQKDYFVPRPMDFTVYNSHIIAAGDPQYPNYIFPSRDYKKDFWIDDIFQVTFPAGDNYFTAIFQMNIDCYVFSKHGTWRIREVNTDLPYFMIQQVSSKLGCITTSKGIMRVGQRLLLPTSEGLMWFDGFNFSAADDQLNNIFLSLTYNDLTISTGGNPSLTVGHVPSFEVEAVYDSISKNVLYSMPSDTPLTPKTVYIFNTKIGQWSKYNLPLNMVTLFNNYFANTIGFLTNNNCYEFNRLFYQDFPNDCGFVGQMIPSTLETQDVDFAETTCYKTMRMWGNGLVDVNYYFDRETTPVSQYTNVDLSANGTIGFEMDLGWTGNYLRWEIVAQDSTKFELKAFELIYNNNGIKKFINVAT